MNLKMKKDSNVFVQKDIKENIVKKVSFCVIQMIDN